MEEKEWLECGFPKKMLDYIQGRLDQRKQRLLACVCVRSVWHNLRDERFRALVELSEDYADGRATAEQLDLTARHLFEVASRTNFLLVLVEPPISAMAAAMSVGNRNIPMCLEGAWKNSLLSAAPCILRPNEEGPSRPDGEVQLAHSRRVAHLYRDIIGNPFHAISLHPDWLAWNGGTVGQLAETIYEERRYQDLPVLADALEEAGCDEAELLDHLRGSGVHARGCWALDLARGV